MAPNACGTIQLTDSVVCNNPDIRGLTQCTKVWITPANGAAPDPNWDQSDIALKASDPFDFKLTSPALGLLSRIYPNPADSKFTVALPAGVMQVHLSVFDAQGGKVAESTAYNPGKAPLFRELDLVACRAGVYLVKIQTEEASVVKRVVLR